VGVYMKTMPLTNQETLANLERVLVNALELSKESSNYADFKALCEAENAYISFVETHG
jgi:hypothetical protein